MAVTRWAARISPADPTQAANWDNGVPSGTTGAFFDGILSQADCIGADMGAGTFDLKTAREYRGNIGSPTNPLRWAGPSTGGTGSITVRGYGSVYVHPDLQNPEVIVDSPNLVDALTVTAGDVYLDVKRGKAIIAETAGIIWLMAYGPESRIEIAERAASQTAPSYVNVMNGEVICKRILNATSPQLIVSGGVFRMEQAFAGGLIYRQLGGVVQYAPISETQPVLGLYVFNGVLDASETSLNVLANAGIYIGPYANVKLPAGSDTTFAVTRDFRREYP